MKKQFVSLPLFVLSIGSYCYAQKPAASQLGTELDFRPNPFLFFRGELTWFNSGRYLKDAGPGKDIAMAGVTAQLRF